jgi:hypothetical protein
MYENYTVNQENLEEGFLKSKLLVLVSYCDGLEVLVFTHCGFPGLQSHLHVSFLCKGS